MQAEQVRGQEMGKGGQSGTNTDVRGSTGALRNNPGPADFKGEGGEAELL